MHISPAESSDKAVEKLSARSPGGFFFFRFPRDYKQVAYRAAPENQYAEIYSSSAAPGTVRSLPPWATSLKDLHSLIVK